MKSTVTLVLLLCLLKSVAFSQNKGNYFLVRGANPLTLVDKPFPKFSLNKDSVITANERWPGKIVYINFWFAACPPCMQEMPQLNKLFNELKADTNFVFVSLTDDGIDKVELIKRRFGIKYNVYSISQRQVPLLNRSQSFPAHVILDSDGIVRSFDVGGTTAKKLKKKIDKLLNGGLSTTKKS